MIIEIFGKEDVIKDCLGTLNSLPKGFVPVYFSENEGDFDRENDNWENEEKRNAFISNNSLGFFLQSEFCKIDVSYSGNESSIFFEITKKKAFEQAKDVLCMFSKYDIDYAYASMWEERLYRNGLVKDIGPSTIENWVGRDYKRYLPGIYWGNLISVNMFKALKLDCSTFIKKSYSSCKVNENFYFFQMFEKATEWQDFAPELDEVCENTSGVFSKWKIWDEIDKIEDEKEYFATCSKWP